MSNEDLQKKRVLVAFDYDLTLSEKNQQEGLFELFLPQLQRVYSPERIKTPTNYFDIINAYGAKDRGLNWLQCMLHDQHRVFEGKLTKQLFTDIGKNHQHLSPGIPEGLWDLKLSWRARGISIHYVIVSLGLKEIIEASPLNDTRSDGEKLLDSIIASEYLYTPDGTIRGISDAPSSFEKTKAIIEAIKGDPRLLDQRVERSKNPFSYANVIVVGDGYTDISYFSFIRKQGGQPIAVYKAGDYEAYTKAKQELHERISVLTPRDYRPESRTRQVLDNIIQKMSSRTCDLPPVFLHEYKRNRIKDPQALAFIRGHLSNCPDCTGEYTFAAIPPA